MGRIEVPEVTYSRKGGTDRLIEDLAKSLNIFDMIVDPRNVMRCVFGRHRKEVLWYGS